MIDCLLKCDRLLLSFAFYFNWRPYNWENHRRSGKHNDSLIVKYFLVESFNSYFTLFYIGFVKQNMYHLAIQLMLIISTRFVVDQFIEYGVPMVGPSTSCSPHNHLYGLCFRCVCYFA